MDIILEVEAQPTPKRYGDFSFTTGNRSHNVAPLNPGKKTVRVTFVIPENISLEESLPKLIAHASPILSGLDNRYNFSKP